MAMGEAEQVMAPLVYQLNNLNSAYKEASKHVRLHLAAPKSKAKAKSKATPKSKARA